MRELVTDSHALLWHLYDPARVGPRAREALMAADAGEAHIYIPAVVVAESLMVAEKGRVLGLTVERLLEHFEAIRGSENFLPTALSPGLVLASHRLTAIPDIFDRLIVTEAKQRGLPLLTRDSVIRESGLVETIWE